MPEKAANSVTVVEGAARDSDSPTTLKNMRFRRGRAAKACEVCHARKVRCDMTENYPCTNCKAFSLVCTPREGRSKGAARRPDTGTEVAVKTSPNSANGTSGISERAQSDSTGAPGSSGSSGSAGSASGPWLDSTLSTASEARQPDTKHTPKGTLGHDPAAELPPEISACVSKGNSRREPHTRLFMGATSHAVLQDNKRSLSSRTSEDPIIRHVYKNSIQRDMFPYTEAKDALLHSQGAFLLPTPELSDHLVDHFFKYAHPLIPVLNRMEFMSKYQQDRDSPPLLLRQAVFCVGARTSMHPSVRDAKGSTRRVALTFYLRAKALYDAEYEKDSFYSMLAAALLGLAIDHPFSGTHNAFYWTRVAITLAQGLGLHRKSSFPSEVPADSEARLEERRHRRIWWTLFLRDVQTSMSYGRPIMINLEDCNVDMVSVEDFEGAEADKLEPGSDAMARVLCFIQSVRLYEISGLIMRVQYSVGAERLHRLHLLPDVTQCDGALAEWVNQLPGELNYSIRDSTQHEFVRAVLYLQYYTIVCLAHRPQVSHLFRTSSGDVGQSRYPSWGIAFQAAHMISRIFENLALFDELQFLPAAYVYTAFLAVMMLSYQRHSNRSAVVEAARRALTSVIASVKTLALTHETASWIVVLGEELLHDDRVALRLARTLWPKRNRDTVDDDEPYAEAKKKSKPEAASEHSAQAANLHLATRTTKPMEPVEGLFPGMKGGLFGNTEDFADEGPHVASSGDEGSLPDTLVMADWYDYLMTVPDLDSGLQQRLDPGGLESSLDGGLEPNLEARIADPGIEPATDSEFL